MAQHYERFTGKTLKTEEVMFHYLAKQPQTISSHVIQEWNILIQNLAQKNSLVLFILLSVLKMKIS